MSERHGSDRPTGDSGSALILALLVTFIVIALGMAFLFFSDAESMIAQNERNAARVLYAAEAGARVVQRWFDRPGAFLLAPTPAQVDRTARRVVDETDPDVLSTPANGGSVPYYKQGIDLDGDGVDDLFRSPYRGDAWHKLMGTRDGPDLRIDDGDPGQAAYLEQLSRTLFGAAADDRGGVRLRISRIDVFAPPYIETAGGWARYGIGTVLVVARLYAAVGTRAIAERGVQVVLNEAPYAGPYGPLHSCSTLSLAVDPLPAHWGAITAESAANVDISTFPQSLPRDIPSVPRFDPLAIAPANFAAFKAAIAGQAIPDPWARVIIGGRLAGEPTGNQQPFPPPPPPGLCCDRSNMIQELPPVSCPSLDYNVWKAIATSGGRDVHYFAWATGDRFREGGAGPETRFQDVFLTRPEGVFFFDTRDGRPPIDLDADGRFDNLTPDIVIGGGSWAPRGLIFLNAERLVVDGAAGVNRTLEAPGEPYQDADLNGRHDPGEEHIDLDYLGPTAFRASAAPSARASRGPGVTVSTSFHGILFTNGAFEATGAATYYGSVIARAGVTEDDQDGTRPTPALFWDESIRTGWPPPGWELPRVVVTRWETVP